MKTRYRIKTRLFRAPLVILQVADRVPYNYDPAHDITPGGYCDRWRDATPEDLINKESN